MEAPQTVLQNLLRSILSKHYPTNFIRIIPEQAAQRQDQDEPSYW